jgi:hypothetical protein
MKAAYLLKTIPQDCKLLSQRSIQVGGLISTPYLDAILGSFCSCSSVNGGGFLLMSVTSKPTSTKSCSIPAGDNTNNSFAISLVSFLKLCNTLGVHSL